ncbi:MAG: hypothetical protein R6U61_04195 [Thermoplasmata archaeon]
MGEKCEEGGGTGKCSRCDGTGYEEHGLFGLGLIEEYFLKWQVSRESRVVVGTGEIS